VAFAAYILADSISPDGVRYTTFQITYPHAVHKDILRHRVHASSYLSFRAYPTEKLFQMLEEDPFIPEKFQEYRKGMDVGSALDPATEAMCESDWIIAKDAAVESAKRLMELGVNKGHANILIQDFCWITGIVSGTEWGNFWALRANPPSTSKPRAEVIKIAKMMYDKYEENKPEELDYGELHLPLVNNEDWTLFALKDWDFKDAEEQLLKVSTGRCARTSYLTHFGVRDLSADVGLHNNLMDHRHMSPFDHPAWPIPLTGPKYIEVPDPRVGTVIDRGPDWRGHLYGWCSYRKTVPQEYDFSLVRDQIEEMSK